MSTIQNIFNPEILISKLSVPQNAEFSETNESTTGKYDFLRYNAGVDLARDLGLNSFVIIINGLSMQSYMIDYMNIDSTGKYPKITMRILPNRIEFFNLGLPKDGDLINVYYRSTFNELHPIRNDFIITHCYEETSSFAWIIHGVLHVKDMFYDTSFSYNGTSLKTAIEIAKKLKLGFATNISDTDDAQKWLCASEPIDTFLDTLKKHAWKNDRSFFDMYIDNYYMLNFIDVRKQLTNEVDKKMYPGLYNVREFIETNTYAVHKVKDDDFKNVLPVFLTNWKDSVAAENYITHVRILNKSSKISLEDGHKKFIHFYDYSLDEKIELNNELIISNTDMSDYSVLISGYTDTDWKKNIRHLWKGISYTLPDHNVHPFYYKAEYHNEQNLKEIDKLTIEITLPEINFNLYRYMIVPILYYEYGKEARMFREIDGKFRQIDKNEILNADIPYSINQFISGFYIIKGFSFNYVGARDGNAEYIDQKVILTRTEWPKNIIIPDELGGVATNYNK